MRLRQGNNDEEISALKNFVDWVLQIGNGSIKIPTYGLCDYLEDDIIIPPQFCDSEMSNDVENMISWTYPEFLQNYKFPQYINERAILTPTNQIVGHLNSVVVDTIPGDHVSYFSVDQAEDFGGTATDLSFAFPPEYLNSITIPGLPPHELKLKEGVAVMLMRNLNQTLGHCNGTRMMVTKCFKQFVECEVICGAFVGTNILFHEWNYVLQKLSFLSS
ncbi:ATP-dependent DNA helicase [Heracleum sosnowskyi]|uniref:ATP-dependent DNA helicase n=1 Tax=Heracleum sosnowskyi TaxID=360622 RepID=A0AAD8NBV6_9APIA|nr:ATP-dependent DNA helicase [Heracleum sosnowskyi]